MALDAAYSASFWALVRKGAGASSTSFWCRRCSEQSRVETTTTCPLCSARHLGSPGAGRVELFLNEAPPSPERGDPFTGGGVEEFRDFLARASDFEAATTTTEGGFDRNGEAVLSDKLEDFRGIFHRIECARREWRADSLRHVPGGYLVTESVDCLG